MTIEITRDIAYAPPPPVPERALGVEVLQMTKRFGEFVALDGSVSVTVSFTSCSLPRFHPVACIWYSES